MPGRCCRWTEAAAGRGRGSPVFTSACHCAGCQTMSANPYSLSMMVPAAGFAVIADETEPGGLHGAARHNFRGWCKTWMFTTMDLMGPFVNPRPSVLDDHGRFAPVADIYVSEGLPWAKTGAPRSFSEFPPMEEFAGLLAEFADWDARR